MSVETKLDWLRIAKLAGEHGVRYRTNSGMAAFLSALDTRSTTATEGVIQGEADLPEGSYHVEFFRGWEAHRLASSRSGQGEAQGDVVERCDGACETFDHADDCRSETCALNGDVDSCQGKINVCPACSERAASSGYEKPNGSQFTDEEWRRYTIRDDVPPTVHSRRNETSGKWETPVPLSTTSGQGDPVAQIVEEAASIADLHDHRGDIGKAIRQHFARPSGEPFRPTVKEDATDGQG